MSEHWLWRLSAEAWLEAGRRELELASEHVEQWRTAVAHARRSAGMALNGVLVAWGRALDEEGRARLESQWGRSYVDHLRAIAAQGAPPLPDDVQTSARELLEVPVLPPALVRLGAAKLDPVRTAVRAAANIVAHCASAIAMA